MGDNAYPLLHKINQQMFAMKVLWTCLHIGSLLAAVLHVYRAEACFVPTCKDGVKPLQDFFEAVIDPEQCDYSLYDVVILNMKNRGVDTVYVTPGLQTYKGLNEKWITIVEDLRDYWAEVVVNKASEYAVLEPIPPGGTYRIPIAMIDIARSFPNESVMRFGVKVFEFYNDNGRLTRSLDYAGSWMGTPFLISAWSESDDSVRNLLSYRGRRRDTVFARYDPINHTPVIPLDIFEKPPYRLIVPDPFDAAEVKLEHKTRYLITWPVPSIEGSMDIVVSRRQVWLQSGHDNPNPNEIFWVSDIGEEQYRGVQDMLRAYSGDFEMLPDSFGFVHGFSWRKYKSEAFGDDGGGADGRGAEQGGFKGEGFSNARRIIEMVNSFLSPGGEIQFPLQEDLDRMQPVRWELSIGPW